MGEYLLGYDIGTQSAKGILVDTAGTPVSRATRPCEILRPFPGWAEHDPDATYWGSFRQITRELIRTSGVDPRQIRAIGIDAMVPSMLPVDRQGRAVSRALLYSDNRAVRELEEANRILGTRMSLEKVVPKILWYRQNDPGGYARTAWFTQAHSYLVARLTGRVCVDLDTACAYGEIFDPDRLQWDRGRCSLLGIDPETLPPPEPGGSVAGTTTAAAEEAGLVPGIPVMTGTGDSFASLLGYGVIHPGEMMIYLGTAGTQILCCRELGDLVDRIHISDAGRTVEWTANILACGQALEWLRRQFFPPGTPFSDLDAGAAAIPPGAQGLITLPHFLGIRTPRPDPSARGSIHGLHLDHGPFHLYRSLLEGISFGMRDGWERVGRPVGRIVLGGGGARSGVWREILSQCLGRALEVPDPGGAELGSAYMAGMAVGLFPDLSVLEKQWIGTSLRVEPDPEGVETYQRLYRRYREISGCP